MESPNKPKYVKSIRKDRFQSPNVTDSESSENEDAQDFFVTQPSHDQLSREKKNQQTKSNDGTIQCDTCGKYFKLRGLKAHTRVHNNNN